MKIRRIRTVAAGMAFLLIICTAGCGRQSEEAVQQGDATEEYTTTELVTESPTENSDDVSMETTIGETEREETFKPVSEMTVAERIKTLTVEGCSLPLPCKVEDMGEGLSLGEGVTGYETTCFLLYNGEEVGKVSMPDVSVATDHLVDMSTGYEKEWVTGFIIHSSEGEFELSGVTWESTMEEIINLWGEPDVKKEDVMEYNDVDKDTGETIAYIYLCFFGSNGKMSSISMWKR